VCLAARCGVAALAVASPGMKPAFLIASVIAAIAPAIAPGSASAAATFTSSTPITIGTGNKTSPYPSSIDVQGLPGRVGDVAVSLHGFTDTNPGPVDILLVAPNGQSSILMSDACAGTSVAHATWLFSSLASEAMPAQGPCDGVLYRPTDYVGEFADGFGPDAPPGPYAADFGRFVGVNPNGTWRLYVRGNSFSASGKIEQGWSLALDTAVPSAVVPANVTGTGAADAYPLTRTVSGVDGVITDVNVSLSGVYHGRPEDLELMLEGPDGQVSVLMSDVCTGAAVNQSWRWDDAASYPMLAGHPCADGSYKPTFKLFTDEPFPLPLGESLDVRAPLSTFNYTDPNGSWRLWAMDDQAGDGGLVTGPFQLDIKTRPRATVAFAEGAIDLTEGQTHELKLVRSAPQSPGLGSGSVFVTSSPLLASPGSDRTPVRSLVEFAPGQTEATIPITALADRTAEGSETFALTISPGHGDARPATPPTAVLTIHDPPSSGTSGGVGGGTTGTTGAGSASGTGGSGGTGGGHLVDRVPPVISGVSVTRKSISYVLSERAMVTFQFQRVTATRGARRYATVGTIRRVGRTGRNQIGFNGRVGRRVLAAGTYRLRVRAQDAAGNRSKATRLRFSVVSR
jgi:subtilisin-like proprotein convertase family protein